MASDGKPQARLDSDTPGREAAEVGHGDDSPVVSRSLCACVSDDAERCMALRYPDAPDLTDDGEPERCECSCHDFQGYYE